MGLELLQQSSNTVVKPPINGDWNQIIGSNSGSVGALYLPPNWPNSPAPNVSHVSCSFPHPVGSFPNSDAPIILVLAWQGRPTDYVGTICVDSTLPETSIVGRVVGDFMQTGAWLDYNFGVISHKEAMRYMPPESSAGYFNEIGTPLAWANEVRDSNDPQLCMLVLAFSPFELIHPSTDVQFRSYFSSSVDQASMYLSQWNDIFPQNNQLTVASVQGVLGDGGASPHGRYGEITMPGAPNYPLAGTFVQMTFVAYETEIVTSVAGPVDTTCIIEGPHATPGRNSQFSVGVNLASTGQGTWPLNTGGHRGSPSFAMVGFADLFNSSDLQALGTKLWAVPGGYGPTGGAYDERGEPFVGVTLAILDPVGPPNFSHHWTNISAP
jgi:hypothetical protein